MLSTRIIRAVTVSAVTLLAASNAAHAKETIVTIPIPSGASEAFILDIPAKPIAAVILFPGGNGEFDIEQEPSGDVSTLNNNFLIRTRQMFVAADIATLVLDVPSDRPRGINEKFRKSAAHAQDIAAAIAWLNERVKAPIWLVGTSMGSISAAAAAISLGSAIHGVVLTSSVSAVGRSSPGAGVSTLDLEAVSVPALVMDDTMDACPISPPGNAAVIARRMIKSPRTEVKLIDGGATPMSGPCEALSYHGYYGADTQAVNVIVSFIKAQ